MALQGDTSEMAIELATIPGTSLKVSRVALGTWAIGGLMWGGSDEAESISTIRAALEHGINVIDTAPAYGFGRSEEIVGKAIAEGRLRSRVVIATKTGLEWQHGSVFRNASRARILREIGPEAFQRDHFARFAPPAPGGEKDLRRAASADLANDVVGTVAGGGRRGLLR